MCQSNGDALGEIQTCQSRHSCRRTREGLDAFERSVVAIPGVMECYLMSGDADYRARARCAMRDAQALERLIVDELTRIPNIKSIRSSFALKRVIYSTAIPLPGP